jgi:hypothetical protein
MFVEPPVITFEIAASASKDARSAFVWAMELWNLDIAQFRIARPGEKATYKVFLTPEAHKFSTPGVVGWISSNEIWIDTNVVSKDVTLNFSCMIHVSLHELGHALGLKDIYSEKNWNSDRVMGALNPNRPVHALTAADVAEVVKIHGPRKTRKDR